MAKSKLITYILVTIFTLIVIVSDIILISRGTYLTPIFATITVILTWVSLLLEKNKSDDHGNY
jgi:membrane-associated HD superfamily phosphohydrolase